MAQSAEADRRRSGPREGAALGTMLTKMFWQTAQLSNCQILRISRNPSTLNLRIVPTMLIAELTHQHRLVLPEFFRNPLPGWNER